MNSYWTTMTKLDLLRIEAKLLGLEVKEYGPGEPEPPDKHYMVMGRPHGTGYGRTLEAAFQEMLDNGPASL